MLGQEVPGCALVIGDDEGDLFQYPERAAGEIVGLTRWRTNDVQRAHRRVAGDRSPGYSVGTGAVGLIFLILAISLRRFSVLVVFSRRSRRALTLRRRCCLRRRSRFGCRLISSASSLVLETWP